MAEPDGVIKIIRMSGNGGFMIRSNVPEAYIGNEPARMGGGGMFFISKKMHS